MGLGTLPYQFKIVSVVPDQAATGFIVTFDILDSYSPPNVQRSGMQIDVGNTVPYADLMAIIKNEVWKQMIADAGSMLALMAALVGRIFTVDQ